MLFKSLQEHTRGRVDWAVLDQWAEARDSCQQSLEVLRDRAGDILKNILSQDTILLSAIEKNSQEAPAFSRMVEGITRVIWLNLLSTGSTEPITGLQTTSVGNNQYTTVEFNGKPILTLYDQELAETVKDKCSWAITNLYRGYEGGTVEALLDSIQRMLKIVEYLEEVLDPLVLRSMILNTRCELCLLL